MTHVIPSRDAVLRFHPRDVAVLAQREVLSVHAAVSGCEPLVVEPVSEEPTLVERERVEDYAHHGCRSRIRCADLRRVDRTTIHVNPSPRAQIGTS